MLAPTPHTPISTKFGGTYFRYNNDQDWVLAVAPYDSTERRVPEPQEPIRIAKTITDSEVRVNETILNNPITDVFSRLIQDLPTLGESQFVEKLTTIFTNTTELFRTKRREGKLQLTVRLSTPDNKLLAKLCTNLLGTPANVDIAKIEDGFVVTPK